MNVNMMKQWLVALEDLVEGHSTSGAKAGRSAIASMRAAIEQAEKPVASIHRDTLAMLPDVRAFDAGAKVWPVSKAKFDDAYVPLFTYPTSAVDIAAMAIERAAQVCEAFEGRENDPWDYAQAVRAINPWDVLEGAPAAPMNEYRITLLKNGTNETLIVDCEAVSAESASEAALALNPDAQIIVVSQVMT